MTAFSLGARLHLGVNSNLALSLPQSYCSNPLCSPTAPSSEGAKAAPPQNTEFSKVQAKAFFSVSFAPVPLAANAKRAFSVQSRVGQKRKSTYSHRCSVVAQRGFEPRQTESESVVLPLHNWAISKVPYYYSRLAPKCQ